MTRAQILLLLTTASILPSVAPAQTATPAKPAAPAAAARSRQLNDVEGETEIVVNGQRPRGSVVGDIQPELTLNAGDVRALGVTSISDLISELGPQLTSGRGGQPLVLLEGHRVSSFREIASIPSEAIVRVEILPEETALKYGFPADQKVVNIVLRQRFRAITTELENRLTTDGGGNQPNAEFNFLSIRRAHRFNIDAKYTRNAAITEAQRGIFNSLSGADTQRTLSSAETQLDINATYFRPLSTAITASINGEITTDQTKGLIGPSVSTIALPGGGSFLPTITGAVPLGRSASTQTAHLGTTINGDWRAVRTTLTATYDRSEGRTISDRSYDLSAYEAAVAAGSLDPALPVANPFVIARPGDIALSRSDIAGVDLTANTEVARLPAGPLSVTGRIGGSISKFAADSNRLGVAQSTRLERKIGLGNVSVDVPLIKSPSKFIGKISVNGNGEIQSLSDYGTVRTFGGGVNWQPRKGISLIASYKDAESAPTVQDIGNPQVLTTQVPVFDFQTGQSVLVRRLTGGNTALLKADQRDWRLGLTLKPLANPDVSITVDYNNRKTDNGVAALPGTAESTQFAFADRFQRDASGALFQIDARPINIARQENSSLRWGINISKRLKTPQSQIDAMRAAMRERFPNGRPGEGGPGGQQGGEGGQGFGNNVATTAGGQNAGGPAGGATTGGVTDAAGGRGGEGRGPGGGFGGPGGPGGPGGFGGGPGGGGFGGRGGGGGGRINLAVYHTINLTSTAVLRDGLPVVDLLNGGTIGSQSGQPRHEVEFRLNVSQSGLGARLSANWQSATRVVDSSGVAAANLRFSPLTTINLRLFANVGQMQAFGITHPWARGMRVSLNVNNIFNERQRVTDGTGMTPLAYRPGFLDPLGRTIQISVRKAFF